MSIQLRLFITDPEFDLEAYVVVDSLVDGRAMGGTRMTPAVDIDEVADLAYNMSLKLALANLPVGGAKAGIRCGLPEGTRRDQVIEKFGQAIAPLLHGGIYLGIDQGTTFRDRDNFFHAAHFKMHEQQNIGSLPCPWSDLWTYCGDITGFGICEGFDVASDFLHLKSYRTAVIQGFGAVGRGVALRLERRGIRVIAIADKDGTVVNPDGLPLQTLIDATNSAGMIDRTALPPDIQCHNEPDAWLQVDTDILVLAASRNAIHENNAHQVHARIVLEGGNFACSQSAHQQLTDKNIPILPAIVINAGGAILTGLVWSNMTPGGLDVRDFVHWLYTEVAVRIRRNMHIILNRSLRETRPLSDIAQMLAIEKLENSHMHSMHLSMEK